ncbi:MAG: hypothetical protein ACI8RD_010876 [Bacillariaceae sp.]|jgi:hypothetical protein
MQATDAAPMRNTLHDKSLFIMAATTTYTRSSLLGTIHIKRECRH